MKHIPLTSSDGKYEVLPDLYEKYRLSIYWPWWGFGYRASWSQWRITNEELQATIDKAIKHHWLVCRHLEKNPEVASAFLRRKKGYLYYDVLAMAEAK